MLLRLQYVELLTNFESSEIIETITYDSLLCFVRQFKEDMRFLCRVEGLVLKEDAVKMFHSLRKVRSYPRRFFGAQWVSEAKLYMDKNL